MYGRVEYPRDRVSLMAQLVLAICHRFGSEGWNWVMLYCVYFHAHIYILYIFLIVRKSSDKNLFFCNKVAWTRHIPDSVDDIYNSNVLKFNREERAEQKRLSKEKNYQPKLKSKVSPIQNLGGNKSSGIDTPRRCSGFHRNSSAKRHASGSSQPRK